MSAAITPTNCLKLLVRARKMYEALGVMSKVLKLMRDRETAEDEQAKRLATKILSEIEYL